MPAHTAAQELIPRRAVQTVLALLLLLFAAVAVSRLQGTATREPDARTVAQRALLFDDRADGGIDIRDAGSGALIDSVHGEQGFLRGTLRGMARERKRRDITERLPLQLLSREDGRLTLFDPATGTRMDLESFGRDNAAVFARWLAAR